MLGLIGAVATPDAPTQSRLPEYFSLPEETPPEEGPPERNRRRAVAPTLVGVIVMLAAIYVIVLHKAFELTLDNGISYYDSGLFASIGNGILHGQMPYVSFWSDKPPGIFLVDAATFLILPANPWSLHVVETIYALAGAFIFYWTARRFASGIVSAIGAFLFAYLSTLPVLNQGGNLAETYWQLPVTLATGMALWFVVTQRGRWKLVLAGVAAGAAILLKPEAVLNVLVIAGCLAATPGTWRRTWRDGLIVAAAAAAVAVPVCLYFLVRAGGVAAGELLAYDRIYANSESFSAWFHYLSSKPDYREAMKLCVPVWTVALAAGLWYRRSIPAPVFRLVFLTFLAGLVAALADRHPFPHDLMMSIPGTVLLLALGLETVRTRVTRAASLAAVAAGIAVIMLVSAGDGSLSPSLFNRFTFASSSDPAYAAPAMQASVTHSIVSIGPIAFSARPAPASELQDLAMAVDRLSPPGSRLYVFGNLHGLYFAADRTPESRFLSDGPLVGFFGGVFASGYDARSDRQELLHTLRRRPPALIVAGGTPSGNPKLFPEFARLLHTRFHVVGSIDGYRLYRPGR